MYTVIKRMEISAAHSLSLSYPSKCEYLHGHNWIITVHCRSKELNTDGMVIDFTHIKQVVKDQLDHRNLNEVLPFNPTAENIARWICDQLPTCYKVEVQESEGNTAIYEKDYRDILQSPRRRFPYGYACRFRPLLRMQPEMQFL